MGTDARGSTFAEQFCSVIRSLGIPDGASLVGFNFKLVPHGAKVQYKLYLDIDTPNTQKPKKDKSPAKVVRDNQRAMLHQRGLELKSLGVESRDQTAQLLVPSGQPSHQPVIQPDGKSFRSSHPAALAQSNSQVIQSKAQLFARAELVVPSFAPSAPSYKEATVGANMKPLPASVSGSDSLMQDIEKEVGGPSTIPLPPEEPDLQFELLRYLHKKAPEKENHIFFQKGLYIVHEYPPRPDSDPSENDFFHHVDVVLPHSVKQNAVKWSRDISKNGCKKHNLCVRNLDNLKKLREAHKASKS